MVYSSRRFPFSSRLPYRRPTIFWAGSAFSGLILLALMGQAASDPVQWQLEMERAQGEDGGPLPTHVGAASAWIVPDRAASNGRAVMLAANGGSVRQILSATLRPGIYAVQLRARGEAYEGWPTVELRLDGRQVATATLQANTYQLRTLGEVALHPGQRLEVVFINDAYGGRGKDRNAVLDRLDFALIRAAAPPASQTSDNDILNVKTVGAKGDGVTDDTDALAKIGNAGGKDIYFPAGIYIVRRPVRFDGLKNQTVYGSGAKIKASEDFAPGNKEEGTLGVLTFRNVQDLTIRDLGLIGKPNYSIPSLEKRADGVYVGGGKRVHIQRLNVQRTHSNGINVDESNEVTIEDNTVIGAYATGIGTGNSNNVKILRNRVKGLGEPDPGKYNTSPGLGIFGWGGNTFLAEGNVLENISDTATKTEGIDNTTYRGNTVEVFGKDGIKVMPRPGHSVSVSNAVVEGNIIRNRHPWKADGTSYILFHSVLGGRVSNNKIESTYRPGSFYEEDAIRVNTFGGGPPSRDIVIEGNEASGTRRGVRLQADGTIFRSNIVRGSDPWARSGLIVSSNGITVSKNVFDGPVIGVLLDSGASRTQVEGNRFSNHSGSGIYADNNNLSTTITDNEFSLSVAQSIVGKVSICRLNRGGECQ